jgi:hypothetical protein
MTEYKEKKSKDIQIKGIIEWAKVFEANRDTQGPDGVWTTHGGCCTVDMLVDEDNYKALIDGGSQHRCTKDKDRKEIVDEDGLRRVKFKRKWVEMFENYGGEPSVGHADGTPWDLREDGLIGNGSQGIAYLSIYPTKKGNGTRLNGLQVLEHVVYESDYEPDGGHSMFTDYTQEDGVSPKKAAKKKEPVNKEFTDDIPF